MLKIAAPRHIALVLLLSLATFIFGAPSFAASIAGSKCAKTGAKRSASGVTFLCKQTGPSSTWVMQPSFKTKGKPSLINPMPLQSQGSTKSDPVSSATPDPSPSTISNSLISIYSGGPGAAPGVGGVRSAELPMGIRAHSTSDNFKLWIFDPEKPSQQLRSPGIWVQKTGDAWHFVSAASQDGIFTIQLDSGAYTIDVTEPDNNQIKYSRGRYNVQVSQSGEVSIDGLSPNSAGYFAVTAVLNTRRTMELSHFRATSPCQILDQSGSSTMSNAFPRATGRLTTNGRINALIIPVDFSDLPGVGDPAAVYKEMAQGTHDFYYKESLHAVNFQFTTFKDYIHLNVPVNTFNLGTYNGGDPGAFLKSGLSAADPIVDFSQFDVVYVLPPSTTSFSQIAYGPAFPNNVDVAAFATSDGIIKNAAVGGADAWQKLAGSQWKWMSHETGHLFGLYDWYTLDGTNPYGPWDIMSLDWSTKAIELNAWNRYISGWLSDEQMQCVLQSNLTTSGKDYKVEVIGVDSSNTKAVTVKLSNSMVLVMEARATAGLDNLPEDNSGLLVYTVDSTIPTIKGMATTYPRLGPGGSVDRAPLHVGDTITVKGVKILVTAFENNFVTVHISN